MRLAIVGCGAVGGQIARRIPSNTIDQLVLVDHSQADDLASQLGAYAKSAPIVPPDVDVVVIASRWGSQTAVARQAIRSGASVVAVADSMEDVRGLLALNVEAQERGQTIVVGAGFSPGLTGVMALHASTWMSVVDEIHIAKVGTGGPWCARQHHRALGNPGLDYRRGAWIPRSGGSGRELSWFPDPVGSHDCYRAAMGDPLLIAQLFPEAERVTARMAATRRDRLTARFPMLVPPHPDGGIGGVRVELRGWSEGRREIVVLGSAAPPAEASATVAMAAVHEFVAPTNVQTGSYPLASLIDPQQFLRRLATQGLHTERFEGAQ
ncbi:MAG: hypothetical protein ACKVKO_00730 [Acidimicrobiales bacterium]|jgi:saccharopine dehydrogenase-like NADP-dependent oxidoreductase